MDDWNCWLWWTNWWLTLVWQLLLYSSWTRGDGWRGRALRGGLGRKRTDGRRTEWDLDEFNDGRTRGWLTGFSLWRDKGPKSPLISPHFQTSVQFSVHRRQSNWISDFVPRSDANWLSNHWPDFHGYAYQLWGEEEDSVLRASNGYFQFGSFQPLPLDTVRASRGEWLAEEGIDGVDGWVINVLSFTKEGLSLKYVVIMGCGCFMLNKSWSYVVTFD